MCILSGMHVHFQVLGHVILAAALAHKTARADAVGASTPLTDIWKTKDGRLSSQNSLVNVNLPVSCTGLLCSHLERQVTCIRHSSYKKENCSYEAQDTQARIRVFPNCKEEIEASMHQPRHK
mmetsp:Transcript_12821/g.19296  ORF Transcript_12821/g.19296 Transcript_12821/m.19296 type:complete len:122 (+) Transcript_12821:278-643(+)